LPPAAGAGGGARGAGGNVTRVANRRTDGCGGVRRARPRNTFVNRSLHEATALVQFGQRVARFEIVDTQNGHSRVVGPSSTAGFVIPLLIRLTCFTSRNTASATIRKFMTSLISWP